MVKWDLYEFNVPPETWSARSRFEEIVSELEEGFEIHKIHKIEDPANINLERDIPSPKGPVYRFLRQCSVLPQQTEKYFLHSAIIERNSSFENFFDVLMDDFDIDGSQIRKIIDFEDVQIKGGIYVHSRRMCRKLHAEFETVLRSNSDLRDQNIDDIAIDAEAPRMISILSYLLSKVTMDRKTLTLDFNNVYRFDYEFSGPYKEAIEAYKGLDAVIAEKVEGTVHEDYEDKIHLPDIEPI